MHSTALFSLSLALIVLAGPAPQTSPSICRSRARSSLLSNGLGINLASAQAAPAGPLPNAGPRVKVHWCVVSSDDSLKGGNIPDELIEKQMDILNNDFAPTGLSFELAETKRVKNESWFNTLSEDFRSTFSDITDPSVLKIFSVSPSATSYSFIPDVVGPDLKRDGVVLGLSALPIDGSPSQGHGLSHEVGHWCGLLHTYEGGCEAKPDGGDKVSDTPPHKLIGKACTEETFSCGGSQPDPNDNFMNDVADSCRKRFTPGQIVRMHEQLKTFRGITVGGPDSTEKVNMASTNEDRLTEKEREQEIEDLLRSRHRHHRHHQD